MALGHPPTALREGLGREPVEVLSSVDFLVVFSNEDQIRELRLDMRKLEELELRGIIVTARGKEVDFVSRFFAPSAGIDEDSVTGSAHFALIPYWAGKLGQKEMIARQISQRGGEIFCRNCGEKVLISGQAAVYLTGHITI